MSNIRMKTTDSKGIIRYQAVDAHKEPYNLKDAQATFIMARRGTEEVVVNEAAAITKQEEGWIEYEPSESAMLEAGVFDAEFHVTWPNGTRKVFPSAGYLQVTVGKSLDGAKAGSIRENIILEVSQIEAFKDEINAKVDGVSAAIERANSVLGELEELGVGEIGEELSQMVKKVNGQTPDQNGNVVIEVGEADTTEIKKDIKSVSEEVKQRTSQMIPNRLSGVTVSPNEGKPVLITKMNNYLWGFILGNGLYRRPLDSEEWTLYTANLPRLNNSIGSILPTSDGEILLVYPLAIYKSKGWSGNPNQITWDEKIAANGKTSFYRFSIDGNGTKFIVASYAASDGFADSRYIRISTDAGETWRVAYDTVEKHGETIGNASHLHGVAYDKWRDRFYFAEGHGVIAGIYCSEDDGQTWVRPDGMRQEPGPTTIKATPYGLVCGSDNRNGGLYGVISLDDISKQEIVQTWKWHVPRDGVVGFAQQSFYDENTGLVYVCYITDFEHILPIIAAGTPTTGGLIYTWDTLPGFYQHRIENLVVHENELYATGNNDSKLYQIKGYLSPAGVPRDVTGNIVGGKTNENTTLAIGLQSEVQGKNALAIGMKSKQEGDTASYSTAIGNESKTTGSNSTAIGTLALSGANSIAIGTSASATLGNCTSIGNGASVSGGGNGTAIGQGSSARAESVSIGKGATSKAGSTGGVAIGMGATANTNGIALGKNTATTANDQVALGNRHLELLSIATQSTEPTSMVAGSGRIYFRTNASTSKMELCVQFPGGAEPVVLATQS